MLEWIAQNREWLFSGIAVAVLGGIGKWLCSQRKNSGGTSGDGTSTHSVQQHNVHGDNVGRDKITHKD